MAALVYCVCSIGADLVRVCCLTRWFGGSDRLSTDNQIDNSIMSTLGRRGFGLFRADEIDGQPEHHYAYGDAISSGFLIPDVEDALVPDGPIIEPGLVFSNSNLGQIAPGTCFYITGTIMKQCERFSINLCYAIHGGGGNIALNVNPRLPQNYVVRNCKTNGQWGQEEVTSPHPFNLHRGDSFSMQILVTDSNYLISINGQHFASFVHRLPYERVRCMQIKGDVVDVQVEQMNVFQYPDTLPHTEAKVIEARPQWCEFPDDGTTLTLPFYGTLSPNTLTESHCLHILGRVKLLPHSFIINLQRGNKIWPHPSIMFHLNPRFANIGGQHVICRNSWFDGKWDNEERSDISVDFMPGKNFHLSILCSDGAYHVYLNKKFIAEYRHRLNPSHVDTVYIQGDIHLKWVALETAPKMETIYSNPTYCNDDE